MEDPFSKYAKEFEELRPPSELPRNTGCNHIFELREQAYLCVNCQAVEGYRFALTYEQEQEHGRRMVHKGYVRKYYLREKRNLISGVKTVINPLYYKVLAELKNDNTRKLLSSAERPLETLRILLKARKVTRLYRYVFFLL